ncbi:MAG TPA: redoxin domain-containing protein [Armatimonadota bacterium]|jgi:peroxiredoxin
MNARQFVVFATVMAVLTVAIAVGANRARRWGPHSASVELRYASLPNATRIAQFALNRPFPDIELTDVNGAPHSLKAARGKVVVLLVQGNRCPCSESYVGRVNAIQRDYAPRGVEVWAFNPNVNETEEETRAFAKANRCRYPVSYDVGATMADMLHAACTTECWVADRRGILRYHGRIDDNIYEPKKVKVQDLRNALDAVLDGSPVPTPETRAYACTIRRVVE